MYMSDSTKNQWAAYATRMHRTHEEYINRNSISKKLFFGGHLGGSVG